LDFGIIIALACLTLPPVLGWFFFWRRRLAEPEPGRVLAELFFYGILSAVPLLLLRRLFETNPEFNIFSGISSLVLVIIIFAFLEEVLKGVLLIFGIERNQKRFDKWEDGFEFAAMIALGFAFAENILYFYQEYKSAGISIDLWSLYLFRSLGTMLGHLIFTGTFGYFYACAYIYPHIVPPTKLEKPLAKVLLSFWSFLRWPFHVLICHLLRQKDSARGHYSGQIIIEGFALAVILHAVFNSLLTFTPAGQSLAFLAVPLLILPAWWYAARFQKAKN
jgi:RsiW-degrading membrane proteinase PrsW (M82 family)